MLWTALLCVFPSVCSWHLLVCCRWSEVLFCSFIFCWRQWKVSWYHRYQCSSPQRSVCSCRSPPWLTSLYGSLFIFAFMMWYDSTQQKSPACIKWHGSSSLLRYVWLYSMRGLVLHTQLSSSAKWRWESADNWHCPDSQHCPDITTLPRLSSHYNHLLCRLTWVIILHTPCDPNSM